MHPLDYREPTTAERDRITHVNAALKAAYDSVKLFAPDCLDRQLALHKLVEARLWATTAIVTNPVEGI